MPKIDLHCHSNCSDGALPPAEVATRAAARGCEVWALTDHDDVRGLAEARVAAESAGMRFVPGVEISVSWDRITVHIVGLNIDPENAVLLAGLAYVRSGRVRRAEAMGEDLARVGIQGAFAGALARADNKEMVGRTHFARFLVENGHVKDVKTAFKKYLVKGKPGYVPHQWAEMSDAIAWIRAAGGQAVLAHPGRYEIGKARMLDLIAHFKAAGGEALEVVTSNHTAEHVSQFARMSVEHGLTASCGSDFHSPLDGWCDLGSLPDLPANVTPIWHNWPEC
ncbi:3',5'-nucleoside bisphosphate phosphatase [Chitinivorax sp. B]|uniref:3',5'-nucleoside bisphosphate phosphatase n=1 Tax=Chitinivorax sp. B TaxID=2502235 RepID=UPI0010F9B0EF|nr:3',5'-nucleoside bisphosphate phosphatase [Chitinivorax sp. B]